VPGRVLMSVLAHGLSNNGRIKGAFPIRGEPTQAMARAKLGVRNTGRSCVGVPAGPRQAKQRFKRLTPPRQSDDRG
jgi:hypothetical protein